MKKLIAALLVFTSISLHAQTKESASPVEYLSNVVLFNPTFMHMHETGGNMSHDIMASGRWTYEIEFKNRKQDAVFTVLDDQNKVIFEVKEQADKAATIIDLSNFPPGLYTIQRKANNKVFVFEVERLM